MNPILEIKDVSKAFPGVKALDSVSIKVYPGTIHAVMGENGAGKSTLMKCIFGLYKVDSGNIVFDNKEINFSHTKEALNAGISMIHQELQNVPQQTVMENIWLGRIPYKANNKVWRVIDKQRMFNDTVTLFNNLGLDINPNELMSNLNVSTCQLIEIARAVSYNAKLIIMDEPTSSLTDSETKILFKIINKLVEEGTAILYITHKLEEVMKITDVITVLRDGQYRGTFKTSDITTEILVNKMVGRELVDRFPQKEKDNIGDVFLRVKNLTSKDENSFVNVSFDVRKGEIFGIGGLVGSQRTELVEAIYGLLPIKSGSIEIDGKETKIHSPIDAINNKIALLTEERASTGIFGQLSITDNMLVVNQRYQIDKYKKMKIFLNDNIRERDSNEYIKKLSIKCPTTKTEIQSLSGGNQQKVLLGRWLMSNPNVLILDEPTRGIDVGAKYEIYVIMRQLAAQGKSIIMISSEMPELMGMSDRIMVMCEGHCSGIIDGKTATDEKIMLLASTYINGVNDNVK